MPDSVHELLATAVALSKLGARNISDVDVRGLPRNRHIIVRNPHAGTADQDARRLMIGTTNGGRVLTLVIERTLDPTTWQIVTGWNSTAVERSLLKWWR